jgi:hypothetical protein
VRTAFSCGSEGFEECDLVSEEEWKEGPMKELMVILVVDFG